MAGALDQPTSRVPAPPALPRVQPAGEHTLIVTVADNAAVQRLAAAVRAHWPGTFEEIVPGHDTLLLSWPEQTPVPPDAAKQLLALAGTASHPTSTVADLDLPAPLLIPVRYDGPDLETVARLAGLSAAALIEVHSAPIYTAAFIGFAPGFAYLIGGDPRLRIPRRASPRTRVPTGAVALAAGYSAVYPSAGPGGWQLIGHTDLVLFDPRRNPPALIVPSMRVRFEPC